MSVSPSRKAAAQAVVDQAVRRTLRRAGRRRGSRARAALERLLFCVRGRSNLLRPAFNRGPGAAATTEILSGLLALAHYSKEWIRAPEDWAAESTNPRPAFSSLARHLVARYPVPVFLVSAWFRGQDARARCFQGGFIHVARGGSLRSAGFPVSLTRAMAHLLSTAPDHFSVERALRWAQVVGLGGSEALAEAVAQSRLGSDFWAEHFWVTVLQFLVNQRTLDLTDVGRLVEYLHHQKFHCERVIIGEDTWIDLDPVQPDLSMKGRTLSSLLRRVTAWEEAQQRARHVRRRFAWAASSIGEFHDQDDEGRDWTIRELLDSDALAREGKAMHHCVADYYVESCARRETTIWSLGIEKTDGRERVLTIEVDPKTKTVVQASMRCNEEPDAWCRSALLRWAAQEGLNADCLAEEPELVP